MLSGRRPWEHPVVLTILDGGQPSRAAPLQSYVPGLDPRLASLIQACLDFSVAQRPSARELVAALEPAREAQGGTRSE
jgi:hypothetical protein